MILSRILDSTGKIDIGRKLLGSSESPDLNAGTPSKETAVAFPRLPYLSVINYNHGVENFKCKNV